MILEVPGKELLAIALFFVIAIVALIILLAIFYVVTGSTGGLVSNLKRNRNQDTLDKDLQRRDEESKDKP